MLLSEILIKYKKEFENNKCSITTVRHNDILSFNVYLKGNIHLISFVCSPFIDYDKINLTDNTSYQNMIDSSIKYNIDFDYIVVEYSDKKKIRLFNEDLYPYLEDN